VRQETNEVKPFFCLLFDNGPWHSIEKAVNHKIFPGAQFHIKVNRLRNDPRKLLGFKRGCHNIATPDSGCPAAGFRERSQYFDRRRFPCAVWSEIPEKLSRFDVQSKPGQGRYFFIFFCQIFNFNQKTVSPLFNGRYLITHGDFN
jgi:hypothetical protein